MDAVGIERGRVNPATLLLGGTVALAALMVYLKTQGFFEQISISQAADDSAPEIQISSTEDYLQDARRKGFTAEEWYGRGKCSATGGPHIATKVLFQARYQKNCFACGESLF